MAAVALDPGRDDAQRAALGLALLRTALVPVIVFGEHLVDRPRLHAAFHPVLAVAAVYALMLLALAATRRRPSWLGRIEPIVDLGLLAALDFLSGGPFSQVRKAFFVLPLGAALSQRPRLTALWSALAVLAYLAVALPHPAHDEPGGGSLVVAHAMYLAWTGAAAVVLSGLLTHRQDRIARLADSRQRLLADALAAEERERTRLAYALHDGPVQNLLSAQLELNDPDLAMTTRARRTVSATITELREAIFELHPYELEYAGLRSALEQLAAQQAARTSAQIAVHVDSHVIGAHDQVVFSLAREMLTNAVRHAHAQRIEVTVEQPDDTILLQVTDDGRGFHPDRPATALQEGHVGLASLAERVEALDGQLLVRSTADSGTTIRAVLPVRRDGDRDPAHQPTPRARAERRRTGRFTPRGEVQAEPTRSTG